MFESPFSKIRDFVWIALLTIFYLVSGVFVFIYSVLIDLFKKK